MSSLVWRFFNILRYWTVTLNLEQYAEVSKTFLEINLTFLINLFTSYFNLHNLIKFLFFPIIVPVFSGVLGL